MLTKQAMHVLSTVDEDKDETVLKNASWMPLKYFYCSRILNITHGAFYNLELCDINSLVVKNASSYSLRK